MRFAAGVTHILLGCIIALGLMAAGEAHADSVAYRVEFVDGFGLHIVQIDLNNPRVKVTPLLAARFPGGSEPMLAICSREEPVAAVTGTFFSTTTQLPIGDIVIDGRLVHFGGMGSALAITPDNRVFFRRIPYGRTQDWEPFESVMAAGPMLLEKGEVALAPVNERFRDSRVLGRASRAAVGITEHNKLLLVATREQMSLWELAKVMRGLGCIDAINFDGGSSTGMYYRGTARVTPTRSLVNMLAVYEDVPPESRVALGDPPMEPDAISRYHAARAYDLYMQAQTPLAKGELAGAIRLLVRATELDPMNASYHTRLAETLARQGRDRSAAKAWTTAGEILLEKELHEIAVERFESALAADPDCEVSARGLAQAFRGLGLEAQAHRIEYELARSEVERGLPAANRKLMVDLATRAVAMSAAQIYGGFVGPALVTVMNRHFSPGREEVQHLAVSRTRGGEDAISR